jgi:hypothetical protein
MRLIRIVWLLFALFSVACGEDEGPCAERGACEVGASCQADRECGSKLCRSPDVGSICVQRCSSQADCSGGLVCGIDADVTGIGEPGVQFCQERCDDDWQPEGVACVEGVLTDCKDVEPGQSCGSCGCPSGQYCPHFTDSEHERGTCQPKVEEGEACFHPGYCKTNNCSRSLRSSGDQDPAGACIPAQGAPCVDACTECEFYDEEQEDQLVCVAECTLSYDFCPEKTRCERVSDEVGWRCLPTCQILPDGTDGCPLGYYCYSENAITGYCWPR